MQPPAPTETTSPRGLHELAQVALEGEYADALAGLAPTMLGPPPWVARKRVELHELLALAQLAPERLTLLGLDATTDIRVLVMLRCAVPCLPPGATDVSVEREAELVIRYPEALLRGPLPGTSLVEIMQPHHVHHPNVSSSETPGAEARGRFASQALCLGSRIPRGFPLRETVLMSYAALTLQAIQLDERDASGVMNLEAARFWQRHQDRLPLSRESFLGEVS